MPAIESEAKLRTKARFDEVFRSYTALSDERNKPKKKKIPPEEHIVLETFTNQLDLSKECAHETIINTYNEEEESPRFTKNKMREKIPATEKQSNVSPEEYNQAKTERKKKKKKAPVAERIVDQEMNFNHENLDQQAEMNVSVPNESHLNGVKKKKKTFSKEEHDPNNYDDDQLIEAYQLQVSQEENNEIKEKIKKKIKAQIKEVTTDYESKAILLNNEIEVKKRRKKKLITTPEPDARTMSLSEIEDRSSAMCTQSPIIGAAKESQDYVNQEEDFTTTKGKKAKRKAKTVIDDDSRTAAEVVREERQQSKRVYDDSFVLGVYIHKSDKLKTDLMISRPMVKVHIFDQKTGDYVKKENSSDAVSSFCEQDKNDYIHPLTTQAYDFKKLKSSVPEWDEQIIFNERFTYFLQEDDVHPKVILFFEV